METILKLLWLVSWQTAVLAAVVLVVTRLAWKAPASWRHALWLLVLVKLFVPPFAQVPAQWAFWVKNTPAPVVSVAAQPAGRSSEPVGVPQSVPAATDSPAPVASELPAIPAQPSPTPMDWPRLAAITWLFGIAFMTGVFFRRCRKLAAIVRASHPVGEQWSDMLADAAGRLGVRRLPEIRLSDRVSTPMLAGLFRPVILLPSGIESCCSSSDILAILSHELAHIKRRDVVASWFVQLAQALFFFHPTVWLAGREMRREREIACDEMVLSASGISREDYAAGYVSALKLANGAVSGAGALAMAEPFDLEKRRLHSITHGVIRKMSGRWVAAMLLLAALGLPTIAGIGRAVPPVGSSNPSNVATVLAGTTAVTGPGVIVTIKDSPKLNPKETRPDVIKQYVVHDYDLKSVVNELFAAGAEAISVNGQRLVAKSSIRCVGPVVLVNSVAVGHPYRISAIGDPRVLEQRLRSGDGMVQTLLLLDMLSIDTKNVMQLPAYRGSNDFKVATPVLLKDASALAPPGKAGLLAGFTPVQGPGVTVTLRNSPKRKPDETRKNMLEHLKVRDFDVRNIVNELMASGADAVSVGGLRIAANSFIKASGDKIQVNSAQMAPPIQIKAIGDAGVLEKALRPPGGVADGLFMLDMISVYKDKWTMVGRTSRSTKFRYAKPVGKAMVLGSAGPLTSNHVLLPCNGRISSPYGYVPAPDGRGYLMHPGVDIAVPVRTPIVVTAAGTVAATGQKGRYGSTVTVDHGGGVFTLYGNCSRILVKRGVRVKRGQVIALSGSSAFSGEPQVHYEKRVNGSRVNPI